MTKPKREIDPAEEARLLAADPRSLSAEERLNRKRAQRRIRALRQREANRLGIPKEERHRAALERRRASSRLARLSPEERAEYIRAQGRERNRRLRARDRQRAAASPEEREKLRAKWREVARKAYAREKAGREISAEAQENARAKWREKAEKALERELAGRAADAPEKLRRLAQKRKEYRRRSQARKYAKSLHYRLTVVLRSRLRSAVRNGQKRGSAIRDLGCTVEELKVHIEGLLQPGMTWDNFGHGSGRWGIDHFFPMKRANLEDRAHVLAVCNWRNLRPEWFSANVRKSARVIPAAQALFDHLVAHFRSVEAGHIAPTPD